MPVLVFDQVKVKAREFRLLQKPALKRLVGRYCSPEALV
jgi:hypothetical protein